MTSVMSKKRAPTKLAIPTDYALQTRAGKAVISRDFFPTMCPSQLNGDWATITVKYRPYFDSCAMTPGTNMVNPNHETPITMRRVKKVG